MRASLYIDEDAMDDDLVQALRWRGADAQTALEAGLVGRPDEEHLAHAARREGRALYTFNVGDFMRLHGEYVSAGLAHAGTIFGDQQRFGVGEHAASAEDRRPPLGRRAARRLRVPQRLAVNIDSTSHVADGRMRGLPSGSSLGVRPVHARRARHP